MQIINGGNEGGFVLGSFQYSLNGNTLDDTTAKAIYNLGQENKSAYDETGSLLYNLISTQAPNIGSNANRIFDANGNKKQNFNYNDTKSINNINTNIGTGESSSQGGNQNNIPVGPTQNIDLIPYEGSSVSQMQTDIKNEIDKNTSVTKGDETVSNNTSIADTGKTDRPTANNQNTKPNNGSNSTSGAYGEVDYGFPDTGNGQVITEVTSLANKVWGSAILVFQILAFGGIVAAGLTFLFSSAEKKADIKQKIIYIIIGCLLVFASSTVVNLVVSVVSNSK